MVASYRYAAGCDLSDSVSRTIGLNLADVQSPGAVAALPSGCKALVWMPDSVDMTKGLTAAVKTLIDSYAVPSIAAKVFALYLWDEPYFNVQGETSISPASFKAIADYARSKGLKTFLALNNQGDETNPKFGWYTPANCGVDYYGTGVYPVRSDYASAPGGYDHTTISRYVNAMKAVGIKTSQMCPVIQCYGKKTPPPGVSYTVNFPTLAQIASMFAEWDANIPDAAFEYVYLWAIQPDYADQTLGTDAGAQAAYKSRYSGVVVAPPPPPPPPTTLPQATSLNAGNVKLDASGWSVLAISADGLSSSWVKVAK